MLALCAQTMGLALADIVVPKAANPASRVRVSHILVDSEDMAKTVVSSVE